MKTTTYESWVEDYASTFGFPESDLPILVKWSEHFEAAGYTADELIAATRVIALDPAPPKFRADHLGAINQHVRAGRQTRIRRVVPDESEVGECVDCGDTGTVCDMPHPRFVTAGQWDGTTCAVTCHCFAGRRIRQAWESLTAQQQSDRKPPSIGWDEYGHKVPNWRALVEWSAGVRAKAQAAREAARVGDLAGPIQQVMRQAVVAGSGDAAE